jgi:hypothetical protein
MHAICWVSKALVLDEEEPLVLDEEEDQLDPKVSLIYT